MTSDAEDEPREHLEAHRRSLPFTFEDLVEVSKVWPLAYGWWTWMNKKPWDGGSRTHVRPTTD